MQSREILAEQMPAIRMDRVAVKGQCGEAGEVVQRGPNRQLEGLARSLAHIDESEARKRTGS
jgi:hypothetical protein